MKNNINKTNNNKSSNIAEILSRDLETKTFTGNFYELPWLHKE